MRRKVNPREKRKPSVTRNVWRDERFTVGRSFWRLTSEVEDAPPTWTSTTTTTLPQDDLRWYKVTR